MSKPPADRDQPDTDSESADQRVEGAALVGIQERTIVGGGEGRGAELLIYLLTSYFYLLYLLLFSPFKCKLGQRNRDYRSRNILFSDHIHGLKSHSPPLEPAT